MWEVRVLQPTRQPTGRELEGQESEFLALAVSLGKWVCVYITMKSPRQYFISKFCSERWFNTALNPKVLTCLRRNTLKRVSKWVSRWPRIKKFLSKWVKIKMSMFSYFIFWFKYVNLPYPEFSYFWVKFLNEDLYLWVQVNMCMWNCTIECTLVSESWGGWV